MKYIDEYRNKETVQHIVDKIESIITKDWSIMEICGGQTHSIMKYGLDRLLPKQINFIHGPGCPVCVTPIELIDRAIAISHFPNVILATYGDMIRVPGSEKDLQHASACGADIRIVFSPIDAVKLAKDHPDKRVVFFAVGFETTAPANGQSVILAQKQNLTNYFLLSSHVLVPPAIRAILDDPKSKIDGFLAPGHVCTVMGTDEYTELTEEYHVPIVITGFEPVDILSGTLSLVELLEIGKSEMQNSYSRLVTQAGNLAAQNVLSTVFEVVDMKWRGIGNIAQSGLQLKKEFADFDATIVFEVENIQANESEKCIAGQVLQGIKKPFECASFRRECTPDSPLGAPMVSSEGACSAYYLYNSNHQNKKQ